MAAVSKARIDKATSEARGCVQGNERPEGGSSIGTPTPKAGGGVKRLAAVTERAPAVGEARCRASAISSQVMSGITSLDTWSR